MAYGAPYRILTIFTDHGMINVWDNVFASIHHPGVFLSTDFLFEKRLAWNYSSVSKH